MILNVRPLIGRLVGLSVIISYRAVSSASMLLPEYLFMNMFIAWKLDKKNAIRIIVLNSIAKT